ncbi:MAG: mechanosensitive ion channel [Desulfovibrionaceae bacterium]|nr:mechanosensitive ion channel [Desulfovibrionaceae bacterium]
MMNELLSNPHAVKGLQSIALAAVILVLARIAISMATRKGRKATETSFAVKYAALFLFAVSLVYIWVDGFGPILTGLSIVAAALTIVAKELILNFIGSFVIFWREIFAIGDRVEIGEYSGDVIDKGILYFTLLETGQNALSGHSTGRLVKVPNGLALTMPIVNATRGAGYVWDEIGIVLTRSSDWEKGRARLLSLVDAHYEREGIDLERIKHTFEKRGIFFNRLTPRAYVDVATGGIRLTLRYLCRARLNRESRDYILTRFLDGLPGSGIELADEQP